MLGVPEWACWMLPSLVVQSQRKWITMHNLSLFLPNVISPCYPLPRSWKDRHKTRASCLKIIGTTLHSRSYTQANISFPLFLFSVKFMILKGKMGKYLNREDLSHQVFLELIQACDFNQMALNGPFRGWPVPSPTPTAVGPLGTMSLCFTRKLFKPRSWADQRDRRQAPSQTFAGSQGELEVGTEVGGTAKKRWKGQCGHLE